MAVPVATTDPASAVTKDAATLNGRVDPNSESTDYYFQYALESAGWPARSWETRTNLHTDPWGETNAIFTGSGAYTCTQESSGTDGVDSLYGTKITKHTRSGTAGSIAGNDGHVFTEAGTYTVLVAIWVPSAWDGGAPGLTLRNFTGATNGDADDVDLGLRDQWQFIRRVAEIDAGDLSGNIHIDRNGDASTDGNATLYTSAVAVIAGDRDLTDFFPTPDQLASGEAAWSGAAHASTSTLDPPSIPATEDGDAGSGADPGAVSEDLTSLESNTTYDFRVLATNASGSDEGTDAQFTTTAPHRVKSGGVFADAVRKVKTGGAFVEA